MEELLHSLVKRQDDGCNGDPDCEYDNPWWYSPAGYAVRYSIVGAIAFIVFLYFIGGYMHAKRRIRKGLPLLSYHRWMVRDPRAVPYGYRGGPFYGNFSNQAPPPAGGHYPMNNWQQGPPQQQWAPPPPVYNTSDVPPAYAPPPGGTKAAPEQNVTVTALNAGAGPSSQDRPAEAWHHRAGGEMPQPLDTSYAPVAGR